jgi:hypothetical protein
LLALTLGFLAGVVKVLWAVVSAFALALAGRPAMSWDFVKEKVF